MKNNEQLQSMPLRKSVFALNMAEMQTNIKREAGGQSDAPEFPTFKTKLSITTCLLMPRDFLT